MAQQCGTLGPQGHLLQDDGAGVVLATHAPAHGTCQEPAALDRVRGGGQGGGAGEVGDPGGVHGIGDQGGEAGLQGGQPCVDLAQALCRLAPEPYAGALEVLDGEVDQAGRLGIQDAAVRVPAALTECVQSPEPVVEARVELVGVVVGGQVGAERLLQGVQVRAVGGRGQRVQDGHAPVELVP